MSAPLHIALIEDHESLRATTEIVLIQQGYRVFAMACAEDLEDMIGGEPIDIFIIDLNLPGEDGISLASRIRQAQPTVGIIMLTARSTSEEMEVGFDSGADIYLIKPVKVGALTSALKSLARRLEGADQEKPTLTINQQKFLLKGPEGETHLTPTEQAMLVGLARAPGHRMETVQFLEMLGQTEDDYSKPRLEVRIVRLRKKLISVGADNGCLQSIRLVGYQLCCQLVIGSS